jgi:hypothetical protein
MQPEEAEHETHEEKQAPPGEESKLVTPGPTSTPPSPISHFDGIRSTEAGFLKQAVHLAVLSEYLFFPTSVL